MVNKHKKFIEFYKNIAIEISKLSYCQKKKVGCVIVKGDNILSFGYNGTPKGCDNNCEDLDGKTKWNVIHAESNAILKAAKEGKSLEDATMFITYSPCKECSKQILQSGIKNLYYLEEYKDTEGLEFLSENGVNINKLN